MNPRRPILALDPGLRELGYAVLDGPRLVDSGVGGLRSLPKEQRLLEGKRLVRHWVRLYHPGTLVIERTSEHPKQGLASVHQFSQYVQRMAHRCGQQVVVYSAQQVRKHLVGNGWANKTEVARVIVQRFPALRIYLTQDRQWKERYWQNMFDAVALALHREAHPPSRSRSCG
jgi:Holliday junction resolvasome RuvABC endonuclease subunit